MARIQYSENGNSPLQRLLGHNQEVLKKWDLLLDTFYQLGLATQDLGLPYPWMSKPSSHFVRIFACKQDFLARISGSF